MPCLLWFVYIFGAITFDLLYFLIILLIFWFIVYIVAFNQFKIKLLSNPFLFLWRYAVMMHDIPRYPTISHVIPRTRIKNIFFSTMRLCDPVVTSIRGTRKSICIMTCWAVRWNNAQDVVLADFAWVHKVD